MSRTADAPRLLDDDEDSPVAALDEAARKGETRLSRRLGGMLATGFVGGADVSIGVFALLAVQHETGSHLAGSLAFTTGFIALAMAGCELFTENFLVPVAAVGSGRSSVSRIARLWGGTLLGNIAAGWLMMALVVTAFPDLRPVGEEAGRHFVDLGIGLQSLALGMFAGMIITLMTWMELGRPIGARLVSAVVAGFLLSVGEMNHVVVASMEMFAGLIGGGADYGYLDWLRVFGWAAFGNMLGGIGLVTLLRTIQVRTT